MHWSADAALYVSFIDPGAYLYEALMNFAQTSGTGTGSFVQIAGLNVVWYAGEKRKKKFYFSEFLFVVTCCVSSVCFCFVCVCVCMHACI